MDAEARTLLAQLKSLHSIKEQRDLLAAIVKRLVALPTDSDLAVLRQDGIQALKRIDAMIEAASVEATKWIREQIRSDSGAMPGAGDNPKPSA